MGSKLFFSLGSIKPQKNFDAGSITSVTSDEAAGLVNISFAELKLKKDGTQEPIWHPNANKIGYCQKGSALISMRTPTSVETYTVKEGDVFFIPQGYVHQISNIGINDNVICFAFNHAKPQVMNFSNAVNSISDSVFTATFATPPKFSDELKKSKKQDQIKALAMTKKPSGDTASKYKFNVAASPKVIQTTGGYLQVATKNNLPVLDGLGILGFGLKPKGIVEPHWHTNAGELVYIVKGQTKITVLAPDGTVETLDVKGGEGAFAPASHFHNIENVGKEDVEVIAYFSHAEPDYIGIGEVLGSYSNDLLGSIFNVAPAYFDKLKKQEAPLVIGPK